MRSSAQKGKECEGRWQLRCFLNRKMRRARPRSEERRARSVPGEWAICSVLASAQRAAANPQTANAKVASCYLCVWMVVWEKAAHVNSHLYLDIWSPSLSHPDPRCGTRSTAVLCVWPR